MSQTQHPAPRPPAPPPAAPPPPGASADVAPPNRYTTRPPGYEDAPAYQRTHQDGARLAAVCQRLEDTRQRIAHTLDADALAALQTACAELRALCGMPEAVPVDAPKPA